MAKRTPSTAAAAVDSDAVRLDALRNALTGLGESTRDKSIAGRFWLTGQKARAELDALWSEDGIAQSLVAAPVDEAWREGWTLDHAGDPVLTEAVQTRARDLRLAETMRLAQCYERAYGGGAVLIGAEDGTATPDQPLNDERVKRVRWLLALDPQDVWPSPGGTDTDPASPTFGRCIYYEVRPRFEHGTTGGAQFRCHYSRLMMFRGLDLPMDQRQARQGWGGSRLELAYDAIRNWRTVANGFALMATDMSVWIHKIPGLMSLLQQNKLDVVKAELLLRDRMRGIANAQVCDANGGDVSVVSRSLAGIGDLAMQAQRDLAATADVPLSRLFGVGGSGLAQSHETDMRRWYDSVTADREARLRPAMERILRLVMREAGGVTGGKELPGWAFSFGPLERMTEAERAEIALKVAQADTAYWSMGLDPRVIFRNRFATADLSVATVFTPEELDANNAADPMGEDASEPADDDADELTDDAPAKGEDDAT